MSVKFGLWTFHKLEKRQKKFTLLAFGCPNHDHRYGSEQKPILKSESCAMFDCSSFITFER